MLCQFTREEGRDQDTERHKHKEVSPLHEQVATAALQQNRDREDFLFYDGINEAGEKEYPQQTEADGDKPRTRDQVGVDKVVDDRRRDHASQSDQSTD